MTDSPMATIRVGRIKATIWQNQDAKGNTFHSTTFSRSYRDENNEWKETNSFSLDDLPRIRMASEKAFETIHEKAQNRTRAQDNQPELPNTAEQKPTTTCRTRKKTFAEKVDSDRTTKTKAATR